MARSCELVVTDNKQMLQCLSLFSIQASNQHQFTGHSPSMLRSNSIRLWAVRGRRLLPFSRLTQLRAICYVRMERDKERLRYEVDSKACNCRSLHHLPTRRIHKKDRFTRQHTCTLACTRLCKQACTPCAHRLHNQHCLMILVAHTTHAAWICCSMFAHIPALHVLCTHHRRNDFKHSAAVILPSSFPFSGNSTFRKEPKGLCNWGEKRRPKTCANIIHGGIETAKISASISTKLSIHNICTY